VENLIIKLNQYPSLNISCVDCIVRWTVASSSTLDAGLEAKLKASEGLFSNHQIYQVLFFLIQRYQAVRKTKEIFLKFLFRKSFKYIKKQFDDQHKGMLKRQLAQKFIETYLPQVGQKGHKLTRCCSSFTKTKLIKKISNKFLKDLLSNDRFLMEFIKFLKIFKEYAEKESNKKIPKLVHQIQGLIDRNQLEDIKNIHHLPWLNLWLDRCKSMGEEITNKMN